MIPAKLKNLNLFNEARSYLGEVAEVTLPKLTIKTEGWRGGGMIGEVKIDMGLEALELEWKLGGIAPDLFAQFGNPDASGVLLRFMGAYQRDDASGFHAVEVVVRGRHEEIDMGGAKAGDDTEHTVKTACTYYKLIIDGADVVEIDMLAGTFVTGGVDRYEQIRTAIGG